MFAIGVTDQIDQDELRAISSEPQILNQNYFVSPTFEALADIETIVTSAICPGATPTPPADCEGATDLIFVADRSGSICQDEDVPRCDNWNTMLNFMANLVEGLNISPGATRVGVIVYGNLVYLEIGLDEYSNADDLRRAILAIDYDPNKRTNIADAIELMVQEFEDNPRRSATQIGVVISDGISTVNSRRTIPEAEAARSKGIIMFAIGVTDQIDQDELRAISSEPQILNQNYFVSPTFEALADIETIVTSAICPGATPTPPADCEGATDLIFVADRSGSICQDEDVPRCDNWNTMLNFMANLVEGLNISPGATRVGVIVYGNLVYLEIGLDEYSNADDLRRAILAIDYDPNKRTNIADAIELMVQEFEDNPRRSATQIGVVISDGISTVNSRRTIPEAEAARSKGIIMFAIGVTDQIDQDELRAISSEPQILNQNYFVSPTFEALADIETIVTSAICPGATPTPPADCEGATDLIFVADRSGSICQDEDVPRCDNWNTMLNFMANLVEGLNISPGATRVGVIVYGNLVYLEIGLDEYSNADDLRRAILAIDYDPNKRTNIADAIELMVQEFEDNPRRSATQIGVVISDGISTVNSRRTIPEAEAARSKGIIMFAIGVTDQIDQDELRAISSEPQILNQNYFVSPTFEALADIETIVTSAICPGATPTPPADCEGATDLIFVADRSGSICQDEDVPRCDNWNTMLNFMANLVEGLNISPGATRVGVIVYGNLVYLEIGLDEYSNADDLRRAILAIDYDPNKRTNIADAIELMVQEFEDNPRRSATQIGVVISDGISTVNSRRTIPEAEAARSKGIIMFAIGVTDQIDQDELRAISSEPQILNQNYFVSPTFEALADIETIVTSAICPGATPTPPADCEGATDLIFVADRSGSICQDEDVPRCDNWNTMLNFMANLVEGLNISPGATRVGVIVYGNLVYLEIGLDEYSNADDLRRAILAIDYDPNKRTNIADAIELMVQEFEDNPRRSATQIGVVISDGISTVNSRRTIPEAEAARSKGIIMFAIGVTDQIDQDELRAISSEPQILNQNYFVSPTFEALADIETIVTSAICPGATPTPPADCEGATDLIFVADRSGSICQDEDVPRCDNWNTMLNFMANLVEGLNISPGATRVGVIVYGNLVYLEIGLE